MLFSQQHFYAKNSTYCQEAVQMFGLFIIPCAMQCKALRACTVILMQKYIGMFFHVYQMHVTFFIIRVIDRICIKKEFFCVSVVLFSKIRKTCTPFHFLQCKIQANFSPLSCQNKLEMEKFGTCCSLHEKGKKKGILVISP